MTGTAVVLQETQSHSRQGKWKKYLKLCSNHGNLEWLPAPTAKAWKVYTEIFNLVKKLSIFIANTECFGLPCYLSSPFKNIFDTYSVKYWQKKSKRKAEDEMLNRLGTRELYLPCLMAVSLWLMLPHTSLTPLCIFPVFPVIPQIFPPPLVNPDLKLRPLVSVCSVPVLLPTFLLHLEACATIFNIQEIKECGTLVEFASTKWDLLLATPVLPFPVGFSSHYLNTAQTN